MSGFAQGVITIALAIVGLAILTVIFNSRNTSQVISAGGNVFTNSINAALGPLGHGGSNGGGLNFTNAL